MDVVESIAAFRGALKEAKTVNEVASWWDWCEKIEASINSDPGATEQEKQLIASLKVSVDDGIRRVRDYGQKPDPERINPILFGLQTCIERRTIRPDRGLRRE